MGLGIQRSIFWKKVPESCRLIGEAGDWLKDVKVIKHDASCHVFGLIMRQHDFDEVSFAFRDYLRAARSSTPNAQVFIGILDEKDKYLNKRVLRDRDFKKELVFSADELRKWAEFLSLGTPVEYLEGTFDEIFQDGLAKNLTDAGRRKGNFVLQRMLATPSTRDSLMGAWAEAVLHHSKTAFTGFEEVTVIGSPHPEHAKVMKSTVRTKAFHTSVPPYHYREADMLLVHDTVNRNEGDELLVSTDGDVILGLLLNYDRKPESKNVYINIGRRKKGEDSAILNLKALHDGLEHQILEICPGTSYPVQKFAAFLLFGGNDYIEKPFGMGQKAIEDFFFSVGHWMVHDWTIHDHFVNREVIPNVIRAMLSIDTKGNKKNPRLTRYRAVKESLAELEKPKGVQKPPTKQIHSRVLKHLPPYEDVVKEVKEIAVKRPLLRPEEPAWVDVYAAQILWYLRYITFCEPDPFEQREGKSVWGWVMTENGPARASEIYK